MNNENLTNPAIADDTRVGLILLDSQRFWEGRRLYFNVFVGLSGLLPMLIHGFYLLLILAAGAVAWGIFANVFYSLGYVVESYMITKSKGHWSFENRREFLFWAGVIGSCMVTGFISFFAPIVMFWD